MFLAFYCKPAHLLRVEVPSLLSRWPTLFSSQAALRNLSLVLLALLARPGALSVAISSLFWPYFFEWTLPHSFSL